MSQVNYNIDLDNLNSREFDEVFSIVWEIAIHKGYTREEILDREDLFFELFKNEICEKYHYDNLKLGKKRKLQNLHLYTIDKCLQEGFLSKFEGQYRNRFELSFHLPKAYNHYGAFVFCPELKAGYMIYGDPDQTKKYIQNLVELTIKAEDYEREN